MLYRRFFAQGRNGYMGVDEYHYDSLEAHAEGDNRGYPGRCMTNVGCYKPLKIGREVADLMNRAYWNGRQDGGDNGLTDLQKAVLVLMREKGLGFVAEAAESSWKRGEQYYIDPRCKAKGIRGLFNKANKQVVEKE
jgi:hypothetical protein